MGWDQRGNELGSGPLVSCVSQSGGFLCFIKTEKGKGKGSFVKGAFVVVKTVGSGTFLFYAD